MAFRVMRPGLGDAEFGNEDTYEFLQGGVLAIHRHDPKFEDEYYPLHKWEFVGADTDHRPGKRKGGGGTAFV